MTVAPSAFLTALNCARSPSTQVKRRWGPMRTLSGLGGAGCSPARAIAPTPPTARATRPATWRGPRSVALTPRTISPGTVTRSRSASASSCAPLGSGRGIHFCSGGATGIGSGEVSNRTVAMSTPENAVDESVVGLGQQGEAVAGQPLDQPDLPQRPRAVERLGEDAAGKPLELLVAARAGQRRVAHVEADVEVRIVDPDGAPLVERHERQPLAVAGDQMEPGDDLVHEVLVGRRVAVEHHAPTDVHVRRVALQMQKRAVETGQAVRVGHALDSDTTGRDRAQCDNRHLKRLRPLPPFTDVPHCDPAESSLPGAGASGGPEPGGQHRTRPGRVDRLAHACSDRSDLSRSA